MTVWRLATGRTDEVATLVVPLADQVIGSMKRFGGDGATLEWAAPMRLDAQVGKGTKPKPLGDLGPFLPGALVLSERAHAAFQPFLSQFGQLLELDVSGIPHWFFNVTNLVSCIDRERSGQRPGGTIGNEAFIDASVPVAAAVFKDPITAKVRIYVNDPGKQLLEEAAAKTGVLGMRFLRAGLAERAA